MVATNTTCKTPDRLDARCSCVLRRSREEFNRCMMHEACGRLASSEPYGQHIWWAQHYWTVMSMAHSLKKYIMWMFFFERNIYVDVRIGIQYWRVSWRSEMRDVMMMLCRKDYCVPLHVRQLVCSDRDWSRSAFICGPPGMELGFVRLVDYI